MLTHTGFIKLTLKNLMFGFKEILRSCFVPLQVANLNKFLPELTELDVKRGPAGVRAQAIDASGNIYLCKKFC